MKNVDYIIVGDGYAALFFAHQLIKNNKSFILFSEGRKSASQVSAGIINPVVLKKFTTFWLAQEQLDFLKTSLHEIEQYTGSNYLIEAQIHRIFHDENEQKLWLKKSHTPELTHFLSEDFNDINEVRNNFSTGKVKQSARLNVKDFFTDLLAYLEEQKYLVKEKFDYQIFDTQNSLYKNYYFRNIIFCEGMGVKNNPFFSNLPVVPNKGHHIRVKLSKDLSENITIKKKHFLFPLHNGLYFYGGTYDRDQLHEKVDESAVEQLNNGLSEIYCKEFSVEEVHFGFRPTVKDRRPIVGAHSIHKNLFVLNGLGARGILNGCYFANALYENIEHSVELPKEVSIDRF